MVGNKIKLNKPLLPLEGKLKKRPKMVKNGGPILPPLTLKNCWAQN